MSKVPLLTADQAKELFPNGILLADYEDHIEAIADGRAVVVDAEELRRLRNPWQPMETAPKDRTKIDVYHGGNVRSVTWCDAHFPNEYRWFIDKAGFIEGPEAWRPHNPPLATEQNRT